MATVEVMLRELNDLLGKRYPITRRNKGITREKLLDSIPNLESFDYSVLDARYRPITRNMGLRPPDFINLIQGLKDFKKSYSEAPELYDRKDLQRPKNPAYNAGPGTEIPYKMKMADLIRKYTDGMVKLPGEPRISSTVFIRVADTIRL